MAEYTSRVSVNRRVRNVAFMSDGTIWVNYLLNPPAVNRYSDHHITALQTANSSFFRDLEHVGSDDFILTGMTVSVGEQEILNRIVEGLPGFSDDAYPEARKQIMAMRRHIKSGFIDERRRVYWLSVRFPAKTSMFERLRSQAFEKDIFEDTSEASLASFESRVFKSIPPAMKPQRTSPEHMEWLIERSTLRGVTIPEFPVIETRSVLPNNKAFPPVEFDESASGTALLEDFVARMDADDPDLEVKKQSFLSNFRNLADSSIIEVRRPDMTSRSFPKGAVSYQAPFAVTGFPTRVDYGFQNFTAIVDQATGMDGDFTIRWNYADNMKGNYQLNKSLQNLSSDTESNSESVLDAADYDNRTREVYDFYQLRNEEKAPVPMRVAAIFSFGSGNLEHAEERYRAIKTAFSNAGFRIGQPPGGKIDLWELMLPCVASDALVTDLYGMTTANLFGGYAPLRSYRLGDGVGIPFAVNIDNALGQIVHLDLLNATERGNASIAFTGAQGRGKSYAMKVVATWMDALRLHLVMLDSQGEWATFATGLTSYEIIDLYNARVSIDPLKVIDDPTAASEMFVSLFLPLLGVKSDSKVASDFTSFVSPQNRQLHKDRNTARGVFEAIARLKDPRFMDIIGSVNQLLKNDMFAALVDPVDRGVVNKLPPADFNHRVIVFLTRGLRLPRSGVDMEHMDLTERYTIMVNTAVAMYTRRHFEGIKSTGAFVGDEMSFYRGLSVLKPLIQDQDRTGRKFGKFVMAGSQTDEEFRDDEYKLVRKRVVMGQEKNDNAVGSLGWADFDTSQFMVRELVENTSPLDPDRNNLPMQGRAGEAFFNDGVGKGKIRVLPQFQADIERLSDTSTSKFIRYTDHVEGEGGSAGDGEAAGDTAASARVEPESAPRELDPGSGEQSAPTSSSGDERQAPLRGGRGQGQPGQPRGGQRPAPRQVEGQRPAPRQGQGKRPAPQQGQGQGGRQGQRSASQPGQQRGREQDPRARVRQAEQRRPQRGQRPHPQPQRHDGEGGSGPGFVAREPQPRQPSQKQQPKKQDQPQQSRHRRTEG